MTRLFIWLPFVMTLFISCLPQTMSTSTNLDATSSINLLTFNHQGELELVTEGKTYSVYYYNKFGDWPKNPLPDYLKNIIGADYWMPVLTDNLAVSIDLAKFNRRCMRDKGRQPGNELFCVSVYRRPHEDGRKFGREFQAKYAKHYLYYFVDEVPSRDAEHWSIAKTDQKLRKETFPDKCCP